MKGRDAAKVKIGLLRAVERCQTRAAVVQEHADDLAAALSDGAVLPPIEVVAMGSESPPDGLDIGELVIIDGFHRYAAHVAFGSKLVPVSVVATGTIDDAARLALKANAEPRGLRRSSADKRHAVSMAMRHPHADRWSNAEIASLCAVGTDLVRRMRETPSPAAVARTGAAIKAAEVVAAKPGASSREVAAEAGVSRKAARTAIEAARAPQEPPSEPEGAEPVREAPKPTASMLAKAAALPASAPDPLPLLEAMRQMDALRRAIGPMLTSGAYRASAQDFDAGWDRARACVALAVPVPCAHHEGPGCQWCGGDGWYSTSRSKAVEPQHAAMLSIRGER